MVKEKQVDEVNHPSHYTHGQIETIDVIEDWNLNYHLGNCIKYISRAGKKEGTKELIDLKKASWYLNRYIEVVSHNEEESFRKHFPKKQVTIQ